VSPLPEGSPLWISEAEVTQAMSLAEAIGVLEAGLKAEAAGKALNMEKTHVAWEGSNLHAIGAVFTDAAIAGTKTWAHTPGGATPLLALFDSHKGNLLAVIEAFALGQLRTGGISGVATKYLAAPDASELAVIGTGKQAFPQVAAVAAVRPIKRVRIYSPTKEKREAFAQKLREKLFLEVMVSDSVEAAVAGAPIVTLVTRAKEPFLKAAHLAKGAHVNAVGAITAEREEFAQDVFARASHLAADAVEPLARLSKEFMRQFGEGRGDWKKIEPLCQVAAEGMGRQAGDDLTVFKALGVGISDLSLGIEILARARERGLGHAFPHPRRGELRLR